MRWIAIVAAALAVAGWAATENRDNRDSRVMHESQGGLDDGPISRPRVLKLFEGGEGASWMLTPTQFYSAFGSEWSGEFWFYQGDTMATQSSDGGVTFAAQDGGIGAPEVDSRPICNNGPDCAAYSSTRTRTGWLKSNAANMPTGDYSIGIVFTGDTTQNLRRWIDNQQDDGTLLQGSVVLDVESPGGALATVYKSDGGSSKLFAYDAGYLNSSLGIPAPGVRHFVVFTYQRGTDGGADSVGNIYVDGAFYGTNTAMVEARNSGTAAWGIAGGSVVGKWNGHVSLAFKTDKILSASTIKDMAGAILGTKTTAYGSATLTTGYGQAISSDAGTVVSCTNDGWTTYTSAPVYRGCVTAGGLEITPSFAVLNLVSEDLSNAAWAKTSTCSPACTPTQVSDLQGTLGPNGANTADQVTFPAIADGGTSAISISGTVDAASNTFTCSIFARADTPVSQKLELSDGTGGVVATSSAINITTTWQRFSVTGTFSGIAAGRKARCRVINATSADTQHVIQVAGLNQTQTSVMLPYVWTGSAAPRYVAAPDFHLTIPSSISDSAGCFRAKVHPYTGIAANAVAFGLGTNWLVKIVSSTSLSVTDGTNTVTATGLTSMLDRDVDVMITWTGSALTLYEGGVQQATGSYDGTIASGQTLYLGTLDGANNAMFGRVSDIRVGFSASDCQ